MNAMQGVTLLTGLGRHQVIGCEFSDTIVNESTAAVTSKHRAVIQKSLRHPRAH